MLTKKSRRFQLTAGAVCALALGLLINYGVAQSSIVTQAEWAVYMAQGLGLDWNLPSNAKSNDYLARLHWTNSVQFDASHMLEGSTATRQGDGSVRGLPTGPTEALYEVATLRAGDYGFRVKLVGSGMLRIEDRVFDVYQPDAEPKWVDVDRVPLGPGPHDFSLMLSGETMAQQLSVTPPCMLPVEPTGGWNPLDALSVDEMAVTLAKALDLEKDLPTIGDPIRVRGEEFTKTLVYPFDEEVMDSGSEDPFWLTSGGSIVTAVAKFTVPEAGVYSLETRYLSPRPIRWNMDRCLRVVTCPVVPSQMGRRRTLAMELEAGEHSLEVTLPPGAKLDRVDVQRRDGNIEEYIRVVEDEGFKLGPPDELVRRRDALSAARRLRNQFQKLAEARCDDTLVAMEARARAMALQGGRDEQPSETSMVPGAIAGTSQAPDTVFRQNPPVDPPPTGSNTFPGQD